MERGLYLAPSPEFLDRLNMQLETSRGFDHAVEDLRSHGSLA
jgi:hypothetical protein